MPRRVKVGVALAKASGQLGADVDIDVKKGRDVLREADRAVRSGAIKYGVLIAERTHAPA